jgi:hypothetical protein
MMAHPHAGVEWFSQEMTKKLEENSHKRGWDDIDLSYGITRLKQELKELYVEVELLEFAVLDPEAYADTAEAAIQEAADIANFAMMMAWRLRHERSNKRQPLRGSRG